MRPHVFQIAEEISNYGSMIEGLEAQGNRFRKRIIFFSRLKKSRPDLLTRRPGAKQSQCFRGGGFKGPPQTPEFAPILPLVRRIAAGPNCDPILRSPQEQPGTGKNHHEP
jgi:hypothetical protein